MIVSDQDSEFTSTFSMHFFKEVRIKLRLSMTLYSQMDGKKTCEWSLEVTFEELGECQPQTPTLKRRNPGENLWLIHAY